MNNYSKLLSQLNSLRKTTPRSGLIESHRAECPACAAHSLSLSVAQKDGGLILIHCFSGCTAVDVVTAIGMNIDDLFPKALPTIQKASKNFAGGLADWMSAAAMADAVSWAAALVSLHPSQENIEMLITFSDQFQRLARKAIRGAAK